MVTPSQQHSGKAVIGSKKVVSVFTIFSFDITVTGVSTLPSIPPPEVTRPNGAVFDLEVFDSELRSGELTLIFGVPDEVELSEGLIGTWKVKFPYVPSLRGQDFFANFFFSFGPNLQTCDSNF